MTNAETDLDELEALQREAAKLRSERQQTDSTAAPAEGQGSAASVEATSQEEGVANPTRRRARSTGSAASRKKTSAADSQTEAEPPAATVPLEEATPESATTLDDLNVDFNGILKDMEDAARERPVLALLAAFSLGIVVGQMFSRK